MKFDIKHILIFGLALGMTSCVETMKDGDMSTGFLGIPVLDADIQVEEFGATKAAPSLPELSVPNTSALHFKVTGSDSKVVWDQNGLWTTPLKMPVGSYTIEVTYGSNTYRNPWYTGRNAPNSTISAVTEEKPEIRLSLCNSLLAVVLADDFTQHFTPSKGNCVTISSTSGNITTTLGNYVFVPSEEALTIQVAGTSSAGISKTLSWTLKNPLSAATATYVTCSLTTTNAPKIKLEGTPEAWGTVGYIPVATTENISKANVDKMVYIAEDADNPSSPIQGTVEGTGTEVVFKNLTPGKSYSVYATIGALKSNQVEMTVATPEISINTGANHTTNSSSELDGTDFTASISIPEKFKGVVANVNLTLWDGTAELRGKELNATETVWNSDGSEEELWPYLPKGSYTLKGTVSYNNKSANADFTGPALSSPAPTFNIVSQPIIYTSYSVYASPNAIDGISKGATGANTLDGSSIYIKNGIIADAILSNKNYSKIINYSYSDGERSFNEGQNKDVTWGAHTVNSSFKFDNVIKNFESVTCHVTGLPYRVAPPSNSGNNAWKTTRGSTNIDWNGDNVQLNAARSTSGDLVALIQSPSFYLPQDLKVSSVTQFVIKSNSERYNTTLNMYIGGSSSFTKESSSTSEVSFEETSSGTLTTSKPYIEYEAYRPVLPTSISNYYAKIKVVNLYYTNQN